MTEFNFSNTIDKLLPKTRNFLLTVQKIVNQTSIKFQKIILSSSFLLTFFPLQRQISVFITLPIIFCPKIEKNLKLFLHIDLFHQTLYLEERKMCFDKSVKRLLLTAGKLFAVKPKNII